MERRRTRKRALAHVDPGLQVTIVCCRAGFIEIP